MADPVARDHVWVIRCPHCLYHAAGMAMALGLLWFYGCVGVSVDVGHVPSFIWQDWIGGRAFLEDILSAVRALVVLGSAPVLGLLWAKHHSSGD